MIGHKRVLTLALRNSGFGSVFLTSVFDANSAAMISHILNIAHAMTMQSNKSETAPMVAISNLGFSIRSPACSV